MPAKSVALLRGINVGTAKAIAMTELAAVFESLGATDVKTVQRSGNVVFVGSLAPEAIEAAILSATGVQSSVLVLSAGEFRAIAAANPLEFPNGSRGFVTFLSQPASGIQVPDAEGLEPEKMVVTERAVYQWMPDGLTQTKVPNSFWKQFAGHVTARNGNTVEKLLALLED